MKSAGPFAVLAFWIAAATAQTLPTGRAEFTDRRNPPTRQLLDAPARERFELGQSVFNTQWVASGLPRAQRRDGLGPLFNAASCDACHNNGARGRASEREGLAPTSFVMQLGGPVSGYGHVLNVSALPGFRREADVLVEYQTLTGTYADGARWALHEPAYRVTGTGYGALPAATVLKPRIGPALFGVGLLESVPLDAIRLVRESQPAAIRGELSWQVVDGQRQLGRFGWQAEAVSIRDQTQRAFEREMGLSTVARPRDDCTPSQAECRSAPTGGEPEVSEDFMDALETFQRELAVPRRSDATEFVTGSGIFQSIGCAQCHRPALPATLSGADTTIDAYTDLLRHDLGQGLADRRADGRVVKSLWRTPPLWGLGYTLTRGDVALLHDGRARSVEEAILWHGGQAESARERFNRLDAKTRQQLLNWLATL